jgi:hypothetical protein
LGRIRIPVGRIKSPWCISCNNSGTWSRSEKTTLGDTPGSPQFGLFLTCLEVLSCLIRKKLCLFFKESFISFSVWHNSLQTEPGNMSLQVSLGGGKGGKMGVGWEGVAGGEKGGFGGW